MSPSLVTSHVLEAYLSKALSAHPSLPHHLRCFQLNCRRSIVANVSKSDLDLILLYLVCS